MAFDLTVKAFSNLDTMNDTPVNVKPAVLDSNNSLMRVGDRVAYAARGYCGRVHLRVGTILGILHDAHGFALKLSVEKKGGTSRRQTMRNFSRMAKIS